MNNTVFLPTKFEPYLFHNTPDVRLGGGHEALGYSTYVLGDGSNNIFCVTFLDRLGFVGAGTYGYHFIKDLYLETFYSAYLPLGDGLGGMMCDIRGEYVSAVYIFGSWVRDISFRHAHLKDEIINSWRSM